MSETTVSATVAFLFGGMIFLLVYTRLGGMPTVLLALAILVGYIVLEMWHAWRAMRLAKRDVKVAEDRWHGWERAAVVRWIAWAFTPWPGGSASPKYPTEFSDVHDYRKADRWHHPPSTDD